MTLRLAMALLAAASGGGLPSAPDPAVPPDPAALPLRAPRGPAAVTELRAGLDRAGELVADARFACWVEGLWSDEEALDCTKLPGGAPFQVAPVEGKVDLALVDGTLYWTESPFPPKPGVLRRARIDTRASPPGRSAEGVPPGVETLASGLANPHDVAVSGPAVYWIEEPGGGTVGASLRRLAVSPAPAAPETLLTTREPSLSALAVGDRDAYVGTQHGIVVVPLDGGPTQHLADGQPADGLALGREHVYWTSGTGSPGIGSIWRCPMAGGTPEELAQHQTYPSFLTVGGGHVYWTDSYALAILRVAEPGGPVELVAGQQFVHGLQRVGRRLFWIAQTEPGTAALRSAPIPKAGAATPLAVPAPGPVCRDGPGGRRCASIVTTGLQAPSGLAVAPPWVFWSDARAGTVWRAPAGGGTPEAVVTGENEPADLLAARGQLFWADVGGDTVRSMPLNGGMPSTVAKADGHPHGLVAACDALYWAEEAIDGSRGRVRRLLFRSGEIQTVSDLGSVDLALDGAWLYLLLGGGLNVGEDEFTQIFRVPSAGGRAQSLVGYHQTSSLHVWPPPAYAPGGLPLVHLPGRIHPVAFGARDGRLFWMDPSGAIERLDPATGHLTATAGGPDEPADLPARGGVPAGVQLSVAQRVGALTWSGDRLYWASSYAGDLPVGAIFSAPAGGGPMTQVADGHASALAVGGGALFYLGLDGDVVRVSPP